VANFLGVELPIVQAPMAGTVGSAMVIAVSEAGGLGSLPCALLDHATIRSELEAIRAATKKPINVNFFCHQPREVDDSAWRNALAMYYDELGVTEPMPLANRTPFDAEACALVEEFRPEVVSFHFGLPEHALLTRVRATGAKIVSSATTVDEARYLADHGCDAIIAQGFEAGGHRGMFLSDDPATQIGTIALVPRVVDAVPLPVIAAGGIADERGVRAAFALGASAVQVGTAYLFCPEAKISPLYRTALAREADTVITNVFTGRPARAIVNRLTREKGPISPLAPAFPLAAKAVMPIRARAEAAGSTDFTSLWSGQAASLARPETASDLTRRLARAVG
jgi:nitronate monooxygenase